MVDLILRKLNPAITYQDHIEIAKQAGLGFTSATVNTTDGTVEFTDAEYGGSPLEPGGSMDAHHPFAARFYPAVGGGFATVYPPDPVTPTRRPTPDKEEEVQALVLDNGSGMCKTVLVMNVLRRDDTST
ncbi:hypothetical protein DBR46_01800 [Pseudomonas sp. KBW05]|nr:hypothetical protein DBR46_01800 [Pseudomonas sp. KBW05]